MNRNDISNLVSGTYVKVVTTDGEVAEGYVVDVNDRWLTLSKAILNGVRRLNSLTHHSINVAQILKYSSISKERMDERSKKLNERHEAITRNSFKDREMSFLNPSTGCIINQEAKRPNSIFDIDKPNAGQDFHPSGWLDNNLSSNQISSSMKHAFHYDADSFPSYLAKDKERLQSMSATGSDNKMNGCLNMNKKHGATSCEATGAIPRPQNCQNITKNREQNISARRTSNAQRFYTETCSSASNDEEDQNEAFGNEYEAVMFETIYGYKIPTISASERATIEDNLKQNGVHIKHSNIIFSLRAFDWILKILRKTNPSQYEGLTVVIVCANTDAAIDLGFSLAYLQNAQGFNVWVYVDNKTKNKADNEIWQAIQRHMRPGLENKIVLNIDYAPQPDFVVLAMNYNFKEEWSVMIKRLMHHMDGPTFVLDPPANFNPISCKSYTFALVPILPLTGMNEEIYTELILCNLAVPEEIIRQVVSNYESPFGIQYAISIKRVQNKSNIRNN
ncbi:uncharacterized protein LOC119666519 [Teleopsis dalmanni]|uniref:uncharacterized protein LOC119666519 n=1 Tax=Teleopsis dalmanni TaxID=139649 RepID=UPI0018CECD00|nr:uncharacterized protein LOC119666519 [Teleopsis dalmanni]